MNSKVRREKCFWLTVVVLLFTGVFDLFWILDSMGNQKEVIFAAIFSMLTYIIVLSVLLLMCWCCPDKKEEQKWVE